MIIESEVHTPVKKYINLVHFFKMPPSYPAEILPPMGAG
jgi:hypothetical protein